MFEISRWGRVLLFVVAVVTLGAARPTLADDDDAAQVAKTIEGLYTLHVAQRPPGLPSGAELERIEPYLSAALLAMIREALQYQEQWIRAHPPQPSPDGGPPIHDKPPFVDGDFFTSIFEGPTEFKVGRIEPAGPDRWKAEVQFWFAEGADPVVDTVEVSKTDGRYGVDDVIYAGAGDFNPPGRLSANLRWREEGD